MKQGNLVLYKGHTFSKHCTTRAGTTRWKCSRQVRRRLQFIRCDNGKNLVMCDNHTFFRHRQMKTGGTRWKCCRHTSRKCGAYVIVTDDGVVLRKKLEHTHEPLSYRMMEDGNYLRTVVYINLK
ncbi:hypothetical protein ABMA27_001295 [Loxostege sticticalis]|uniref:FLYWCH-type domain-containing protein n=1 Tax=Loxostege sticticalis TaxID=481309 RepID=A0ABR3HY14_LOXSC